MNLVGFCQIFSSRSIIEPIDFKSKPLTPAAIAKKTLTANKARWIIRTSGIIIRTEVVCTSGILRSVKISVKRFQQDRSATRTNGNVPVASKRRHQESEIRRNARSKPTWLQYARSSRLLRYPRHNWTVWKVLRGIRQTRAAHFL